MANGTTTRSGWRWATRTGLSLLLLLLVLTCTWACWYYRTVSLCDQDIAGMRARGERVSWHEVALEDVPDELNAAWHLQQACNALVPSPASSAYPITNMSLAEREVAANAKVFELLRKSRNCTQVSWGTQRVSTGHPPIPQLVNASSMAKVVRARMLLLHAKGDDREAVEAWRDGEAASRTFGTKSWTLISSLVSLICNGINTDALADIAPTLRIGDTNGMTPDELRGLIAALADDTSTREIPAQGFLGERTNMTSFYLQSSAPGLLQPAVYGSIRKGWNQMDAAAANIREYRPMPRVELTMGDRLVGIVPQFTNAADDVHRCILKRRMVAMVLAIRLYHAERGCYPGAAQELIPAGLPKAMMDPRSADTRPLGYFLDDDGRRPLVYSAGSAASESVTPPPTLCTPASLTAIQWNSPQPMILDASDWRPPSARPTR